MFTEMQTMHANYPNLEPEKILRFSTINAAQALGLRAIVGELSPSAKADIIAIPFNGSFKEIYEATLYHKGKILGSMIDGKWAYRNNAF